MKIAVSGASNTGKSTFIDDFIQQWSMYKKADNSYREKAKEDPKVKLNKDGTKEGQEIILNSLIDQVTAYSKNDNVIFDRCVIDNLVYSMWLNEKKLGNVDDLYMEKTIKLVKETTKLYDIIFFIPLIKEFDIPIVKDGQRDIDPIFREETDAIFKAVYKTYAEQKSIFFDMSDCPAVIEIYGNRQERIEMVKFYIDKNGGTDVKSLLT